MRSIDVSQNGTTLNTVNGNGLIHVNILQPQHDGRDVPKARPIGHVFPTNPCHNPANYCHATHHSGTEDEEWVEQIQIVAEPY